MGRFTLQGRFRHVSGRRCLAGCCLCVDLRRAYSCMLVTCPVLVLEPPKGTRRLFAARAPFAASKRADGRLSRRQLAASTDNGVGRIWQIWQIWGKSAHANRGCEEELPWTCRDVLEARIGHQRLLEAAGASGRRLRRVGHVIGTSHRMSPFLNLLLLLWRFRNCGGIECGTYPFWLQIQLSDERRCAYKYWISRYIFLLIRSLFRFFT